MLYGYGGFEIILDTGASSSVTFEKGDFIDGEVRPPTEKMKIDGIASSLDVDGIGTLRWTVFDDAGKARVIQVEGLYVPKLRAKLLSPQQYIQ